MLIWRCIMSDKVTLGEVSRGDVDLEQLAKLNALLDFQAAMQDAAAKAPPKR
jgi:hypothetical protein